jgi:hypothetical protein
MFLIHILPRRWRERAYLAVLKRCEDAGDPVSQEDNKHLARFFGVKPKYKPFAPLWLPIPGHEERKDKVW